MTQDDPYPVHVHPVHDQSLDLRRKKRADLTDELVTRAKWLPPQERELIRTVYEYGRPVSDLAPLLAVNPRTLRRRCKKAVSRALSDEYVFVLHHRDRWPGMLARVATMCIIEGKSLRTAAAELGVPFHTVRQYRQTIAGMLAAALAKPPSKPSSRKPAATDTAPYAPAWQEFAAPSKPRSKKRRGGAA